MRSFAMAVGLVVMLIALISWIILLKFRLHRIQQNARLLEELTTNADLRYAKTIREIGEAAEGFNKAIGQ